MDSTAGTSGRREDPDRHVQFIVLGEPRTGSTMLVQGLNSRPDVRCFGEVFNPVLVNHIDYRIQGYDRYDAEDLELRRRDPVGLVEHRIFCDHPEAVSAVGFKFLYPHIWSALPVLSYLQERVGLRVVHLRRRNLVRLLVSRKIAQMTGAWWQGDRKASLVAKLTSANAGRAARHPLTSVRRLWGVLRSSGVPGTAPRAAVHVPVDELWAFVDQTRWTTAHLDHVFREHARLTVYYEDLAHDRKQTFDRVQAFLGLQPRRLIVTTARQNPEPLRQLIANYDELSQAFRGTMEEHFFD